MTSQDLALLVVIATPVAVLVAMNAWAWMHGERDTLMLPGFGRYPSIAVAPRAEPDAPMAGTVELACEALDPCERLAA